MKKLLVGYSRIDITPEESVPLAGYGNTSMRMSEGVLSPLYSTCIAFSDGDTTVLMFHNDLISSWEELSKPAREEISRSTGVPFGHIMVAATHTHAGPDLVNTNEPSIVRYQKMLINKMTACANQALKDLMPAEMYTAQTQTDRLNFVRHYILEDGSYKGDNFGDLNKSPYAGHVSHADETMLIVKFVRESRRDILLVNWQSHPHRTGGKNRLISADIIGVMRDEIEKDLSCDFIYFNGGAGNINPTSRIAEENVTADYLEQGRALAVTAAKARYVKAHTSEVKVAELAHKEPLNRPDAVLLEGAKQVESFWSRTNRFEESVKMAEPYSIHSPYHAGSIISRHNMKADMIDMPMYAICIGDVAFITAPYEMFDTNAKYIRDHSPFQTTVVISCANDANCYIPSAYGFIHGCYEADCSLFRPGTAERLAQMYLKLLEEIV